jgi:hypothetical protein
LRGRKKMARSMILQESLFGKVLKHFLWLLKIIPSARSPWQVYNIRKQEKEATITIGKKKRRSKKGKKTGAERNRSILTKLNCRRSNVVCWKWKRGERGWFGRKGEVQTSYVGRA